MLSPPRTRVRRRGRVHTRMSSKADDEGGTEKALTGQKRPWERREEDDGDGKIQNSIVLSCSRGGEHR